MEENNVYFNHFLPIGSVIELKYSKKLALIAGYYPNDDIKNMQEYIVTYFPNGLNNRKNIMNKNYSFVNNEDIENVVFLGYQNNSYIFYSKLLKEAKDKINNNLKTNEDVNVEDIFGIIMDTGLKIMEEKENEAG